MKLKGWVVFFFFSAFLFLEGCSLYDYHEYTISLDSANVHSVYWHANDTVYTSSVRCDVGPEMDVFTIKLGMKDDSLSVDIYGCSDYGCTRTDKIVVHNEDFSFTKLLKKGEFEISTPAGNFSTTDFGYDCNVVKDHFFNLKIELKDIKLDLDAQKGTESCYERSNPWCIYC